MKKVTSDLIVSIIDLSVLEYTKNRYISEEEIEDLKRAILFAFDEKIKNEDIGEGIVNLTITSI